MPEAKPQRASPAIYTPPFIVKTGVVTREDFEQTYQAMHWQLDDEAFAGSWQLLDLQATVCQQ